MLEVQMIWSNADRSVLLNWTFRPICKFVVFFKKFHHIFACPRRASKYIFM